MLEENNKMVHEITELVNDVKYNLSTGIAKYFSLVNISKAHGITSFLK